MTIMLHATCPSLYRSCVFDQTFHAPPWYSNLLITSSYPSLATGTPIASSVRCQCWYSEQTMGALDMERSGLNTSHLLQEHFMQLDCKPKIMNSNLTSRLFPLEWSEVRGVVLWCSSVDCCLRTLLTGGETGGTRTHRTEHGTQCQNTEQSSSNITLERSLFLSYMQHYFMDSSFSKRDVVAYIFGRVMWNREERISIVKTRFSSFRRKSFTDPFEIYIISNYLKKIMYI